MAIEKAKVLAALSTKFKGKSLSKTFLDKTATRYAAKIETEADLDDYINDREDDILAAGEEADRRVTAALKTPAEGGKTKPTPTEQQPVVSEDELTDAPPYVKAMLKQMQGMTDEIKGLKAERTAETISQRFLKDERLKGIDPKLLKGRFPKTDDEFEAAVTEAAEDLKDFIKPEGQEQQQQQQPAGITTKIGRGFGDKPVHQTAVKATPADKTKEVPAEIQAFTDNLNKVNGVKTT
jgi:hypothetical protein